MAWKFWKQEEAPAPAKRKVKVIGAPMLTEEQKQEIRDLVEAGEPTATIAATYGISVRHVQRIASGAGEDGDSVSPDLERQLRAEQIKVRLEALKSDPAYREMVLYGEARKRPLDADTIARVHEHDRAEGWERVPATRLEQLKQAEADLKSAQESIKEMERKIDRLETGKETRLAELRELADTQLGQHLGAGLGQGIGSWLGKGLHDASMQNPAIRQKFMDMMAAQVCVQGSEEPEEMANPGPELPPAAAPQQPTASPPGPPSTPTDQAAANMYTRMAIGALQDKTPAAAAKWLAELAFPGVSEILDLLCQSPDEEAPAVLDALATNNPDFTGLMEWIKARDPRWTAGVLKELRRIKGRGTQG